MAALLSSAVTVLRGWKQPGTGVQLATKQLTLVLNGQGDATEAINASALGFQTIVSCSNAIKSDNTVIVPAVPSYDGSKILLGTLADVSSAGSEAPATRTGTFRITVTGSTAA